MKQYKSYIVGGLILLFLSIGTVALKAAAGNINLTDDVATIQCTTGTYRANKPIVNGTLYNAGSNTVFVNTLAGVVATNDAQAQNMIGVPAATFIHLPNKCQSFTYATGTSTSVLYWIPDSPQQ